MINTKNHAFSIAEAFIMLTIVSVALAAAAPMITKQIKHNNLSNVQTNLLGREINSLEQQNNANTTSIIGINNNINDLNNKVNNLYNNTIIQGLLSGSKNYDSDISALKNQLNNKANTSDINTLSSQINQLSNNLSNKASVSTVNNLAQEISELRQQVQNSAIPRGTVAFFNLPTCPSGWSAVSQSWNGRFPRFAGSYTVLSYNTTNKDYNTTGTAQTLNVGATQEDAIRNITGTTAEYRNSKYYGSVIMPSGAFFDTTGTTHGNGGSGGGYGYYRRINMNASLVVPTTIENRPKSVALLGCMKN